MAKKYIDAEKLKAEIEALKRRKGFLPFENTEITEAYMARGVQFTCDDIVNLIQSLQQEQPELPLIGYAEVYYQKGLHNGIIKGQMEILKVLEEIEKRKAEPVLVIKEQEQEQPEVDLEKVLSGFTGRYAHENSGEYPSVIDIARHFYELGLTARKK